MKPEITAMLEALVLQDFAKRIDLSPEDMAARCVRQYHHANIEAAVVLLLAERGWEVVNYYLSIFEKYLSQK